MRELERVERRKRRKEKGGRELVSNKVEAQGRRRDEEKHEVLGRPEWHRGWSWWCSMMQGPRWCCFLSWRVRKQRSLCASLQARGPGDAVAGDGRRRRCSGGSAAAMGARSPFAARDGLLVAVARRQRLGRRRGRGASRRHGSYGRGRRTGRGALAPVGFGRRRWLDGRGNEEKVEARFVSGGTGSGRSRGEL